MAMSDAGGGGGGGGDEEEEDLYAVDVRVLPLFDAKMAHKPQIRYDIKKPDFDNYYVYFSSTQTVSALFSNSSGMLAMRSMAQQALRDSMQHNNTCSMDQYLSWVVHPTTKILY
jgi:hypothetical protein